MLQARGLTIRTRGGMTLLSDISLHIEPGEFIVLTGPSRSGKSTLLQSLGGLTKPVSGGVFIDGVNLYANLKAFRSSIGFVPADFALQRNLSVAEILEDAARLRLPRGTSDNDRQRRVLTLLQTVDLAELAKRRIGSLNATEKRRLSIAVELIGQPGILLVDESAEHLTPSEERQITKLLRALSDQGLTIIQVHENSRSLELSDKVVFLTRGGLLAWFGPADEAFVYLRSLSPGGMSKDVFGLEEALEMLANPQLGDAAEWAKRFKASPAYQKCVDDPLNDRYPNLMLQDQPLQRLRNSAKEKLPPAIVPRATWTQQLLLLIRCNSRLLWRDQTVLFMLAVPIGVAFVDFVLSSTTMLDPRLGDADRAPIALGLLVFLVLLIAVLLVRNEILKERAVYLREQRTSSLLFPYVVSKVWLVGILAIYQGLVWAVIHYFAAIGAAEGFDLQVLLPYAITLALVAFIGGILGLMASSLSRSGMMAVVWVLLFTVPQLFLSGSIIPLEHLTNPFKSLSSINPSRYAFETLLTVSGYGQDIASDRCWQLPADQRNSLSDDQEQDCTCMGVNIFSACRFPGIYGFFLPAIEGQPTLLRSVAIGRAEGVISEAIDHYGQGFNVDRYQHWSILAVMSLCLIVLFIGIQQRAGSVRT